MLICVLFFLKLLLYSSIATKPKLTFDEFFDYTDFVSLSFSPNGKYLLIETLRPDWNSSTYENNFWLYDVKTKKKNLILTNKGASSKPQWSPSGNWIAFLRTEKTTMNTTKQYKHYQRSFENVEKKQQFIYLYSIKSKKVLPILIGTEIPSTLAWSDRDSSIYFITTKTRETDDDQIEWKDVIDYRKSIHNYVSTINCLVFERKNKKLSVKIRTIRDVPFLIGELLFSSVVQKLVFTSVSLLIEYMEYFEIYSIDLQNSKKISRLTNNNLFETQLSLSNDGKHVLFLQQSRSVNQKEEFADVQRRLSSLDLTTGHIERLVKDFSGNLIGYTSNPNGGVYILGQLRTEVHIYTQKSSMNNTIDCRGWNGTYHLISSSSVSRTHTVAFVYSSLEKPKEVYIIDDINQLQSARAITNENDLFTRRHLPKTKVYTWKNDHDNQTIEGILHYPPGKFEFKNLPLLILIHGGPYDMSLNAFEANWYNWAPIAAVEGWLVLEPNYCGSTGYGDQFVNDIRFQPLSRPERDILSAVDNLIKDGTVDPNKLNVGGYSYGGFLTNWLITQTTRFNAALSGAGAIEHVSSWGTMDIPLLLNYLFGGFPWEVPEIYKNQSAIYHLDRVRTATHIITGEDDVRVDADQSYILERGLHNLGIPVKLLVFPKEGHGLENNPWHGKIKVREELKWLEKYGHGS
ncbi:unnamed protein product [Rotaria sp. Silwood1]|nr:unnamed protein product [Rotaria sp. Silwood1]CAF3671836.1 unnamed protein product [Rotaria sp. Silwood1]CAF3769265.1 unnamed protein product [Rotaria sp. Silwood1]CAF3908461.1 unnamed protein product [Rotaria sp. Silwood1]CAF4592551.1 unnamed protein product [Rotaria sp. Silwood1]